MFPLSTKQFSAAFLDVKRNGQGYNGEVSSVDKDAAKKLLRPPHISKTELSSIPQSHRLGNVMWDFMKNCTTGELQLSTHHFKSKGDSRILSQRAPEQSCSSVLPEFEIHRVTSERRTSEKKARQSVNNFKSSTLIEIQAFHTTPSINGTSSSQNTVRCMQAEAQKRDFLQQSSHEEANVSNEVSVNSKLSKSGGTFNLDSDIKSSESECHIVPDDFDEESKLSTACNIPSQTRADVDDSYGKESFQSDLVCNGDCRLTNGEISNLKDLTAPSIYHAVGIEEDDFVGKKKFLERFLERELQIKPLTVVKGCNYSQKPVSNLFTINLSLDTVMSVLCTDGKDSRSAEHSDIDVCGKIAILYGIQDKTVSVVDFEVVGMYDYISGAVYGLQGFCHDESVYQSKDEKYPLSSREVSLDLDKFLAHFQQKLRSLSHHVDNDNVLKEHSPVAWLLISPALGVTLDWQVQEKVLEFIETLSSEEFSEEQASDIYNKGCFSIQWYNLLVVVDEYRCCEKNIPLIEVFEFGANGDVNVVNFDLS